MKNSKIRKILTAVLLLVTLTLSLGTLAASAEGEPEAIFAEAEGSTPSEENAPSGDAELENIFAEVFAAIESFSSEILCALTFIGSLIVAFAYKRGLLPAIKSSIGAIGGAVTGIKDSTESCARHQEEIIASFTERLTHAEEILGRFSSAIDEIREKSEDGLAAKDDRAVMKALMSAQIDMLYDIFMTSSLPQYQKDAVGEKIKKMREVSKIGNEERQ